MVANSAPRSFSDASFRKLWKLLFLRTRPRMVVSRLVILQGLLLSLSQVLFTRNALQAYWEFFVTLLYTALLFVVP